MTNLKPTPQSPRHLLRSLLRASTYLPDAAARQYIHSQILHRFRSKPVPSPTDSHKARQTINILSRASHGDIPALTKVLHYTYGRAGKRRRTLVTSLITELERTNAEISKNGLPPPPIPSHLRTILKPPATVPNHGGLKVPAKPHAEPITTFEKFLADQIVNRPLACNRGALRTAYAPVPAESAWGRPLARRREAGLRRAWKADVLDRVLPPLPEGEWDRLRDLANGVMKWEGTPERRVKVGDLREDGGGSLLTVEYLKTPITHAHAKVKKEAIQQRDWHELTPKFMQRMYAGVWALCPKMRWDGEAREWVYTWGGSRSAASRGVIAKLVQRDLQLFEGIEKLEEKKGNGKKPIFKYRKHDGNMEGKEATQT